MRGLGWSRKGGAWVLAGFVIAAGLWLAFKPAPATPAERLTCLEPEPITNTNAKHPGMVWVPAGSFEFGDTVYPEETPVQKKAVAGFWMDRSEVTNAQFAAFVQATGYVTVAERAVDLALHTDLPAEMQKPGAVVFISPADLRGGGDPRQWWQYVAGASWRHPNGPASGIEGRENFPVVAVAIEDARAYAKWRGNALPSEAQWEWAAGGGQAANGAPQSPAQPQEANTWQGMFPLANQAADGFTGVAPVGCFKPNAFGLFDMIGNVWELTADRYTESHSPRDNIPPDASPAAQRPGPAQGRHVIKGGSFLCAPNYCMRYRPGARQAQEDDLASSHLGFRTILQTP